MRDMMKAVREYNERYSDAVTGKRTYSTSDYMQIIEQARQTGGKDPNNTLYTAIDLALRSGYAIGYRTTERRCAM